MEQTEGTVRFRVFREFRGPQFDRNGSVTHQNSWPQETQEDTKVAA